MWQWVSLLYYSIVIVTIPVIDWLIQYIKKVRVPHWLSNAHVLVPWHLTQCHTHRHNSVTLCHTHRYYCHHHHV
jgi:hypothetical protein